MCWRRRCRRWPKARHPFSFHPPTMRRGHRLWRRSPRPTGANMPEGLEPLEEIADAEGAGLRMHGGPHVGGRRLTLRHAVAQSLAIGPMVSTGVLLSVIA